jgi:capsular polysaccharide biosynthesis protein
MQNGSLFGVLSGRWGSVVLSGLMVASLSFLALVFFSRNFKVGTDFLVVQNQSGNQDFYSLFKSSEYLGKVLSESVYSERFVSAVVETGKVDAGFLPTDKKERLEAWSKMVKVRRNVEAGIIQVEVFHDDQKLATRISQAITDVLTQKNMLFRGGEEKSLEIRILSGPILENNPGVKKIAAVSSSGFLLGAFVVAGWIAVKAEFARLRERRETDGVDTPSLAKEGSL